jgi:hypothetical protein
MENLGITVFKQPDTYDLSKMIYDPNLKIDKNKEQIDLLRNQISEMTEIYKNIYSSLLETKLSSSRRGTSISSSTHGKKDRKHPIELISINIGKETITSNAYLKYGIMAHFIVNNIDNDDEAPYPFKWALPVVIFLLRHENILKDTDKENISKLDMKFIKSKCDEFLTKYEISNLSISNSLSTLRLKIIEIAKEFTRANNDHPIALEIKNEYTKRLSANKSK